MAYEDIAIGALGDATRLSIFKHVAEDGPVAVGKLAESLPISRPAVSQHLRVLKDAGLVVEQRDGTRRLYEINPAGVKGLSGYFDRFWNRALLSLKSAAERSGEIK